MFNKIHIYHRIKDRFVKLNIRYEEYIFFNKKHINILVLQQFVKMNFSQQSSNYVCYKL